MPNSGPGRPTISSPVPATPYNTILLLQPPPLPPPTHSTPRSLYPPALCECRVHSPAAAAPSPRRPPGRSTPGTTGGRGRGPPLSPPPCLSPAPSPSTGAGGRGSLGLEEPPPPPRAADRGEGREALRRGPGRARRRDVRALLRVRGVQLGRARTREGGRGRRAAERGGLHSETATPRQRRSESPTPPRWHPDQAAGRAGGRAGERAPRARDSRAGYEVT